MDHIGTSRASAAHVGAFPKRCDHGTSDPDTSTPVKQRDTPSFRGRQVREGNQFWHRGEHPRLTHNFKYTGQIRIFLKYEYFAGKKQLTFSKIFVFATK